MLDCFAGTRRAASLSLLLLGVGTAGCGSSRRSDVADDAGARRGDAGAALDDGGRSADAGRDAAAGDGGPALGCDDPALWTAEATERATLSAAANGVECGRAEHPLYPIGLNFGGADLLGRFSRFCFRVTSAAAGSGWTVGETVESEQPYLWLTAKGFDAPVSFEARAGRPGDLVSSRSPDPEVVVAGPRRMVDGDGFVGLGWARGRLGVATRNAVHLGDERYDPWGTVRAAGGYGGRFRWVETRGDDLRVVEAFREAPSFVAVRDAGASAARRVRAVPGGPEIAVLLDDRAIVVSFASDGAGTKRRIGLPGTPDDAVMSSGLLVVRLGDDLRAYRFETGAEVPTTPPAPALGGLFLGGGLHLRSGTWNPVVWVPEEGVWTGRLDDAGTLRWSRPPENLEVLFDSPEGAAALENVAPVRTLTRAGLAVGDRGLA